MPKIGMAGSSIMMTPWNEAVEVAIDHGYRALEIFGEFPQIDLDALRPEDTEQARKQAQDAGLEIVVHAPFTSLNIASFNRGIREESIRQSLQAVDLCADLGGQVVVVHTGKYIIYKGITRDDDPGVKLQWQMNIESLRKIAERAEKRGISLCLENIGFEPNQIDQSLEDLLHIREQVGNPSLYFTLDIGHARLAEGVERTIEVLGQAIRHIHFTDNMGLTDDHVILGEGNFDYSGFMDFIRAFPYVVTLEVVKVGTDIAPALVSREFFEDLLATG